MAGKTKGFIKTKSLPVAGEVWADRRVEGEVKPKVL